MVATILASSGGCTTGPGPLPAPDLPSWPDDDDSAAGDDDSAPDDDDLAPDDDDLAPDDDDLAAGCPPGMALVDDLVCVDRFEGALEEQADDGSWAAAEPWFPVDGRAVRAVPADGVVPQAYISGDEAAAACAASGKRLCTSEEWLAACRGPDDSIWPYGDSHQPDACNDTYPGGHPVIDFFGTPDVWDMTHMNDPGINQQPDTVEPGGAHAACVSAWGVYDMHGNLHEWVADASGTFRGGFYADAELNGPGCTYATTAHSTGYHDYSTGFRCCADPQ